MKRTHNPAIGTSNFYMRTAEIVVLLLVLGAPFLCRASTGSQPKKNYWFITANTGIAIRSPEISGGFSFTDDGFRHRPGFAFDLSFGKTFNHRWEPALRWGAYSLFGQSPLPHYTSYGYYAAYPGLLDQEPLEYIIQSNALSLILRFLFSNGTSDGNSSALSLPFIEAGVGVNNYASELRYSSIPAGEDAALIFRNRNGEKANGTVQFVTGAGLKIGAPGEWNALILLNAEWMDFSTLNALTRLTNPSGSSSPSIVSRITAGLTIPIKGTVKRDRYMPFRW
ncbi:MAG: hypothetical protein ACOC0R_03110 [Mariniphaga sp.]